ncbi:MAG: ATP-binding cassette domain-containing protein, partial [Enterobacterales bacterium]|nr:ATP-binding cassette domain-containing protein [Enterobacterales bacterium]
PQDTVLFNESIRYNIQYDQPGASFDDVKKVAAQAHIEEFIESLPDGWDTIVGERGLKLSGGEKQRVAIARALLKKPQILIFDEATSSLDSKTEQSIQSTLEEISQNYTTMIIAHRLSTVVNANRILVMDNGGLIEQGSHEELLSLKSSYAQMWRLQQEEAIETEA